MRRGMTGNAACKARERSTCLEGEHLAYEQPADGTKAHLQCEKWGGSTQDTLSRGLAHTQLADGTKVLLWKERWHQERWRIEDPLKGRIP